MVGAPAGQRLARAAQGLIGIVGVAFSVGAYAADWRFTPRLGVSPSFSDNANLAPDDSDTEESNSAFVTQISPGFSLRGQGGRGNLNIDLSHNMNLAHTGAEGNSNNNVGAASGQLEIWDRVAFIDASASANLVIEDTNGVRPNSIASQNANTTQGRAFSIGPSFRHHFGNWVETLSRMTYDNVSTDGSVDETSTITGSLAITSGRRFSRLRWGINVQDKKTAYDGDQPSQRFRNIDGNGTLILNNKFSLIGGVGYQDDEQTGLNEDPQGVTWNVGITAQPTPRTSLRLTYGDRDDNKSYDFQGSHRFSPKTSISASYNESIQTSQQQIADNLNFLVLDPSTNQFIDVRTGQAFGPDDAFGLSEDTFRQKRFSLSMNGTRKRNSYNINAYWEERDIEAQDTVETSYGGAISFSRRLTPRANANINLTYRNTDSGAADDRTDNEYAGSAGLNYQVRNDLQATLSYNYTFQKVNNAPTPEDTTENSVTLGLTKSF